MTTEARPDAADKDERELCRRLEPHFVRLTFAGRCEWRREVRMLHWRHAADEARRIIRIDYVVRFDDGPLIGVEAKRAPRRPVDWGRYIKQCADYAVSIIGANSHTPTGWTSKPLHAVFLATEIDGPKPDYMRTYQREAARLGSPFRVGFIHRRHDGIQLTLSDDENWWCEAWGYRADYLRRNSTVRAGNGGKPLPPSVAPEKDEWWNSLR